MHNKSNIQKRLCEERSKLRTMQISEQKFVKERLVKKSGPWNVLRSPLTSGSFLAKTGWPYRPTVPVLENKPPGTHRDR